MTLLSPCSQQEVGWASYHASYLFYFWAFINAWMVFSSELNGCECDACDVGSGWKKFLCSYGEEWVSFFQLKLGWFSSWIRVNKSYYSY